MKRVFIVHCWGGYPEYCWYPWVKKELAAQGFEVNVLEMPDPDAPDTATWVPALREAVGKADRETYLIGHSAGCITILRYLESLKAGEKVKGVVLVAGFTDNLRFDELKSFFSTTLPLEKIKEKAEYFTAIHSDNDPFVPLWHGDIFKDKLDAELIVKHQMGHFSGPVDKEDSCLELPDVVEAILKMNKT